MKNEICVAASCVRVGSFVYRDAESITDACVHTVRDCAFAQVREPLEQDAARASAGRSMEVERLSQSEPRAPRAPASQTSLHTSRRDRYSNLLCENNNNVTIKPLQKQPCCFGSDNCAVVVVNRITIEIIARMPRSSAYTAGASPPSFIQGPIVELMLQFSRARSFADLEICPKTPYRCLE